MVCWRGRDCNPGAFANFCGDLVRVSSDRQYLAAPDGDDFAALPCEYGDFDGQCRAFGRIGRDRGRLGGGDVSISGPQMAAMGLVDAAGGAGLCRGLRVGRLF